MPWESRPACATGSARASTRSFSPTVGSGCYRPAPARRHADWQTRHASGHGWKCRGAHESYGLPWPSAYAPVTAALLPASPAPGPRCGRGECCRSAAAQGGPPALADHCRRSICQCAARQCAAAPAVPARRRRCRGSRGYAAAHHHQNGHSCPARGPRCQAGSAVAITVAQGSARSSRGRCTAPPAGHRPAPAAATDDCRSAGGCGHPARPGRAGR